MITRIVSIWNGTEAFLDSLQPAIAFIEPPGCRVGESCNPDLFWLTVGFNQNFHPLCSLGGSVEVVRWQLLKIAMKRVLLLPCGTPRCFKVYGGGRGNNHATAAATFYASTISTPQIARKILEAGDMVC